MVDNTDKPQVLVAQLGRREHYAIPIALHQAGMLAHFCTDAYVGCGSWLGPFAKSIPKKYCSGVLACLKARTSELPGEKIKSFNLLGIEYVLRLRQARTPKDRRHIYLLIAKKFNDAILRNPNILRQVQAFYSMNGVSLELFAFGKNRGIKLIVNQIDPSIYGERLFAEESSLWPDWEIEPNRAYEDELFAREKAEWEMADLIIVNSDFSKNALLTLGVEPNKIRVVPLAVDLTRFVPNKNCQLKDKVNFLFLGNVGLGKGIQYALDAFRRIKSKNVGFIIVGPLDSSLRQDIFLSHLNNCRYLGPVHDVVPYYQNADVMIFPTISDGFGLTQVEAMACGLPVITTPNAGSVVRDGVDGFIVPIRDPDALAEKIELLAKDPDLLAWMSQNARERAAVFSWERYGERLLAAVQSAWSGKE